MAINQPAPAEARSDAARPVVLGGVPDGLVPLLLGNLAQG
jgi:hypothetical protein